MAHFAKLGANGKVIAVLTLNNGDMLNADGVEDESVGQQYLETHNNWPAQMWIQTSYNTAGNTHNSGDNSKAFRGNYAEIDGYYLPDENHFQPVQPFPSWTWKVSTASWTPPVAKPETDAEAGTYWDWDEDAQNWVQIHIVID